MNVPPQPTEVDALLKIKMLGYANRRHDLAKDAASYYDAASPDGQESGLPAVSAPLKSWLIFPACLAAIAILLAMHSRDAGANAVIWVIVFLSSALCSVVGFAFSAVAGAVLFHIDGSYIHAVQTMLVASISLQSYSVFHIRKNVCLRTLAPFLAGGVATFLGGVYIAIHENPEILHIAIGAFLVSYGLYALKGAVPRLAYTGMAGDIFAGALGGITGPVAAFPGPFVTIWCSLKGWDKFTQRGVAQPYILVMQIVTLAAFFVMNGSKAAIDWPLLQYALPAIAGAILGLKLFERLNDRQFLSIVAVFLTLSGLAMMAEGL